MMREEREEAGPAAGAEDGAAVEEEGEAGVAPPEHAHLMLLNSTPPSELGGGEGSVAWSLMLAPRYT